ncbi:MAG TPA: hypothetical protein VNV66_02175 [Pilimelia sp.]|nr:hypothetical protein [Pilimelia sp.]
MGRRGHSTTIGKFAKVHHDRRVSEIRMLGESLRRERRPVPAGEPPITGPRPPRSTR